MTTQITANNITNNTITATQLVAGSLSPKIRTISICDSSYNVLDDTAANTTGGYIQITGSTFGANSQVIIGTNNATSVTYVNTSTIRAQVPAAAATSYPVYVIDTDTGGTAIKINGLTHSSFPAWSTGATLSNQVANTAFGVSLSASSDSNITYSNTSVLPAGTTLAANGYFSGTVTIGVQTVYSFDVKANDAENQDASRTFSVTVTVSATGLFSWGANQGGALGQNDVTLRSSPTQIGSGTTWLSISMNENTTSAGVKTDGTLWTWGVNSQGQLGLNDRANRSSPVQVGSGTTWTSVEVSYLAVFAIKTDGTLWSWGLNSYGQLGTSNIANRSSPSQVGALTNWSLLTTGHYSAAAVKTDGTLWSWGQNAYGQLGQNNVVYRSSPTQVAGTTWSKLSSGMQQFIAIKTDGTLWTWGRNSQGQLGLNDIANRSSPSQVGSGTTWSLIDSTGSYTLSSFAIQSNGTLWAWGRGSEGQLGLNNPINRSSPTQVGSGTTWLTTAAGYFTAGAIKTDGTLWEWGNGILGNNDAVVRSSPVQIGTQTTWKKITKSFSDTMAYAALP